MPPHLKKRTRNYQLVDGDKRFSLKTPDPDHAKILLEQYMRDRLSIPKTLTLDAKGSEAIKRFGKPDYQSSMKKLRFPCVYAFIRHGLIVYVGSSINGFGRILASHHPMVTRAADTDEIVFWTCSSEVDARELEIQMIRMLRPQFNLSVVGKLKSGVRQRVQDPEQKKLKKLIQETIREELKAFLIEWKH